MPNIGGCTTLLPDKLPLSEAEELAWVLKKKEEVESVLNLSFTPLFRFIPVTCVRTSVCMCVCESVCWERVCVCVWHDKSHKYRVEGSIVSSKFFGTISYCIVVNTFQQTVVTN